MIVLSDTSPINYLILIGHIDILPTLFGQIVVPPAVHGHYIGPWMKLLDAARGK